LNGEFDLIHAHGAETRTMNRPVGSKTKAAKVRGLPRRAGWLRRQFSDVVYVARRDKKWWLLPLFLLLMMLAGLLLIASSSGPLAPFVYPFL
jgi:hypothetical protein